MFLISVRAKRSVSDPFSESETLLRNYLIPYFFNILRMGFSIDFSHTE